MRKFQRVISLLVFVALALALSGCLSQLFGFDTGGELIWWCDKCQGQIGNSQTHVCGMTQYDQATGRDVPIPGITQGEVDKVIADRQSEAARIDSTVTEASPQMADYDEDLSGQSGSWWKFWGR